MNNEFEYSTNGLNRLSKECHNFQVRKGFTDPDISKRLMLINTELVEAFEAFRKGKHMNFDDFLLKKERLKVIVEKSKVITDANEPFKQAFEDHLKGTFEMELIDVLARTMGLLGEHGIDVETLFGMKMLYNEIRDFEAEGKKF